MKGKFCVLDETINKVSFKDEEDNELIVCMASDEDGIVLFNAIAPCNPPVKIRVSLEMLPELIKSLDDLRKQEVDRRKRRRVD